MAAWNNATKTAAGLALEQKLLGSEVGLTLTKAKSGTGKVNPTQLALQTDVQSPVQILQLQDTVHSDMETTVTIPVVLSNSGLLDSYALYQVGIYAEDPDAGEILYFIAQTDEEDGEQIPSESESPGFMIDWYFGFNIANANKVEVTLNEAGKLTMEQGDARYAKKVELEALREEVRNIDVTEQLKEYAKTAEVDSKITEAIQENITAVLEGEY